MWNVLVGVCSCLLVMQLPAAMPQKTRSGFKCDGRTPGYYADIQSGCQLYHMCDNIGRRFTYACPNNTLFQQRMFICDHWYMVDCANAERSFSANLRIGQQGPFLEDGEMDGMRTTRPDILTVSNEQREQELNNFQTYTSRNTVGLRSDSEDDAYSPPLFWSTENTPRSSNQQSNSQRDTSSQTNDYARHNVVDKSGNVDRNRAKAIDFDSSKSGNAFDNGGKFKPAERIHISYKSNFKATTPEYPSSVEDTTSSPNNIGLEPPVRNVVSQTREEDLDPVVILLPLNSNNGRTKFAQLGGVKVNFGSSYRATTPVYPTFVDRTSPNPYDAGVLPPKGFQTKEDLSNHTVNFVSEFKATTPVYPLAVDQTSPNPDDVGLLAPSSPQEASQQESGNLNFASNFRATTPVYPDSVELTSPNPEEVGLSAPKNPEHANDRSDENLVVNFASNYKATTPVYPPSVDFSSEFLEEVEPPKAKNIRDRSDENLVNFASNFKATTPVYPNAVDSTSPNPDNIGLVPPRRVQNNRARLPENINFPSSFKATTPVYPESVDATSSDPYVAGILVPNKIPSKLNIEERSEIEGSPIVNFVSNFKATTPVYPISVEQTSPVPEDLGLLPPKRNQNQLLAVNLTSISNFPMLPSNVDSDSGTEKKPLKMNFFSKFKATTPVYPRSVDLTSPNPNDIGLLPPELPKNVNDKDKINFASNYKATTPVYPIEVEDSRKDEALESYEPPSIDLLPPAFNHKYQANKEPREETTLVTPSKFYQPPVYEPDFTDENPGLKIANFMKSFNMSQWQELRTVFRIPEYDFPLEDATRPSYDSVFDSFDAKSVKKR